VVRRCVWSRNLVNEEGRAHWVGVGWGAVATKTNKTLITFRAITGVMLSVTVLLLALCCPLQCYYWRYAVRYSVITGVMLSVTVLLIILLIL
jgi:hypothetical protein